MDRQQRANLEHLRAVVGSEHVMHEEHLTVVQRAEAHALVGARREPVRPVERACAELVAVEVAAPEVKQRRAHAVLTRLGILLDETDRQERAHDPVDGALGKPELTRHLGEAQPAGAPGQQPEDGGGSFDGLDRFGHGP